MKKLLGVIIVLSLCLLAPYGAAQAESTLSTIGYGTGSVLASCLYSPAKVLYAAVGGVTGGLAYGLTCGDKAVANSIWAPSIGGTYVITPEMLKGNEKIEFVGK